MANTSTTTASSQHSTSAPRSLAKRQAPEASVHMNVLGMDGKDHDINIHKINTREENSTVGPDESSGNDNAPLQQPKTPRCRNQPSEDHSGTDKTFWWGKVLWGKTPSCAEEDEEEDSTQYQSLEAPEGESRHPQRMAIGKSNTTAAAAAAAAAGIQIRNLSPSSLMASSSISASSTTTVEDRLKQDCSFFYQGIGDFPHASSSISGKLLPPRNARAVSSTTTTRLRPLTSALYQIPRLPSSRDGAKFRAQYERLNQQVVLAESDDLFLDEYLLPAAANNNTHRPRHHHHHSSSASEIINFTSMTTQDTERLSTLFFEQDGRLLMRLPRDQVRLVMDEDLEPGIISVEQWRKVDENHYNPAAGPALEDEEGTMMILEDGNGNVFDKRRNTAQPPALRYVMTVPDDLYRRVVAEMSYALQPPCWGFFKCCDAEGRADIKLAVAILGFILFLLFVSTMEWPTE